MRRVRHLKRGTEYDVIGTAELQTSTDLVDGSEMIVYRGDDGRLWVRQIDEFEDGRFEGMPSKADPLHWRPDEFGTPDRALYFRGLYAGEVQHIPTHAKAAGEAWRAWVQTAPDPREIGWYHTEAEAKAALLAEVTRAVGEGETG